MTSGDLISDSILSSSKQSLGSRKRLGRKEEPRTPFIKMGLIKVLLVAVFLLLTSALVRLQIFEGPYFRSLAEGNRVKEINLPAPRGVIYDRRGDALVVNLPAFRFKECESLDVGGERCTINTISKDQAIELQIKGLSSGQTLVVDSIRSYPYKEITAHLVGYVNEVTSDELTKNSVFEFGDKVGRGGVEQMYDEKLRGKKGRELVEVDALGKNLRTLSTNSPNAGSKVVLTMDLELQKAVYEAVRNVKAAVVVTNPNNGEVLSMISSPSFDPNLFTDINISQADRSRELQKIFTITDKPLFNRVISGTYPPGSTFKIVTAMTGLESGKISENTIIDDPGILIIGPYRFANWKYLQNGGTQGRLNVVSALKVSNDIFFYRVGEAVGVDLFSEWSKKFGLMRLTRIDLPGEEKGVFPTKDWREKFARSWYLGDTYHLAIGQGDLLVTPLQVNQWTTVVGNGGKMCRPHLLLGDQSKTEGENCEDLGFSRKTLDLVKQGMIQACSPGGTAWPLFEFKVKSPKLKVEDKQEFRQIQIACKTGTAEFGPVEGGGTHAWLTAFAPAENPSIALTVLVEAGGEGSDVAAPIVKKILEKWFSK